MSVPDYDPAAPRHCPSCRTGLRESEPCPWPGCDRFGMRSAERRKIDGDGTLTASELRAWLAYATAAEAARLVIEIEHRNAP